MIPLAVLGAATPRMGPAPKLRTVWDPELKGPNVVISGDGKVATGGVTVWQSVFANKGKSEGRWQFEIRHLSGSSTARPFAALADKTNAPNLLVSYAGSPVGADVKESVGYWGHGKLYWNLSSGASEVTVSPTTVGDVVTVAVDMDLATPEVKFYRNGVLAAARQLPSGKTWFPVTCLSGTGSQVELYGSGLAHPQEGFTDWDEG